MDGGWWVVDAIRIYFMDFVYFWYLVTIMQSGPFEVRSNKTSRDA